MSGFSVSEIKRKVLFLDPQDTNVRTTAPSAMESHTPFRAEEPDLINSSPNTTQHPRPALCPELPT